MSKFKSDFPKISSRPDRCRAPNPVWYCFFFFSATVVVYNSLFNNSFPNLSAPITETQDWWYPSQTQNDIENEIGRSLFQLIHGLTIVTSSLT